MQWMTFLCFVCGLVYCQPQAFASTPRSRQLRHVLGRRVRSTHTNTWSIMELENYCRSITWLGERQRELCRAMPNVIPNTEKGAAIGLAECKHQFRHQRWNCPIKNATAIFNSRVMQVKSAETAFLHAVMSAGVAYSVTRACGEGELQEVCGCDTKYRPTPDESQWNWDGCNDNVRYGNYFTTDFMSEVEGLDDGFSLMNSHNKEAGRQVKAFYKQCGRRRV
ncbi:protein Wnt-3a-like isoform X2 [Ptychodera flava]|uniref:protein Wnt-3a-like isoform X2 n=1 Tax=Ptychodera flava TaxID=63121 RepID=UPI00396A978E